MIFWLDKDKVADLLIQNGADVNAVGNDGQNFLIQAANKGNFTLTKYVYRCCRVVVFSGSFCFSWKKMAHQTKIGASRIRSVDFNLFVGFENTVRLLLEKGANVNVTDETGNSNLEILSLFFFSFVSMAFYASIWFLPGGSALTSAVQSSDRKSIAIAKLLIEHGADLNAVNKYHKTPLDLAINRGISNMIQFYKMHNDWNRCRYLLAYWNILGNELGVELLAKNGAEIPGGKIIDAAFNGKKHIFDSSKRKVFNFGFL